MTKNELDKLDGEIGFAMDVINDGRTVKEMAMETAIDKNPEDQKAILEYYNISQDEFESFKTKQTKY